MELTGKSGIVTGVLLRPRTAKAVSDAVTRISEKPGLWPTVVCRIFCQKGIRFWHEVHTRFVRRQQL